MEIQVDEQKLRLVVEDAVRLHYMRGDTGKRYLRFIVALILIIFAWFIWQFISDLMSGKSVDDPNFLFGAILNFVFLVTFAFLIFMIALGSAQRLRDANQRLGQYARNGLGVRMLRSITMKRFRSAYRKFPGVAGYFLEGDNLHTYTLSAGAGYGRGSVIKKAALDKAVQLDNSLLISLKQEAGRTPNELLIFKEAQEYLQPFLKDITLEKP